MWKRQTTSSGPSKRSFRREDVKFYSFNLMPYRHVDLEEAAKYRSFWLGLPNALFDPSIVPALYNEYIDQLIYAANSGFDGICVNAHHQTA